MRGGMMAKRKLTDDEWVARHALTVRAKAKPKAKSKAKPVKAPRHALTVRAKAKPKRKLRKPKAKPKAKRKLTDDEWVARHALTVRAKAKPKRKLRKPKAKPKAPRRKPRNQRRLPLPPSRVPFASPHTVLQVHSEEDDRLGYHITIHGAIQGGWESESTPVFYEEADTAQFHVIIWRTKVRATIQGAMESYLELLRLELGTGEDEHKGIAILWCELVALYPDHVHVRLDKWIGDDFPHYDFLRGK
jgi:hypothetical protein